MSRAPERACRRSGARWWVDRSDAWVEWTALDGTVVCMPLRDVSPAGVSFLVNDGTTSLEPGRTLTGVRLRFAECEVAAELVVMHVTVDAERGAVCGAMVYPTDERRFATLLSRAEEEAAG